jgi:hypothetical protein
MEKLITTMKLLLFLMGLVLVQIVFRTLDSKHDFVRSHPKDITIVKTSNATKVTIVKTSNATKVSNAYAIVTLANTNYERCAMKLMHELREAGRWRGDLVFMASYEVDAEAGAWLTAQNISILYTKSSSQSPHYLKYHIFTHAFFRQYQKILYLDSDTTVALPIDPLFSLQFPVDVWIVMRDNGPGIGKGNLHQNEFADKLPIPKKKILVLHVLFLLI